MTKKIVFRGALALVIMFVATSAVFAQNDTQEYTKWNVGGSIGFAADGWNTKPYVIGLHGAYFFKPKYGAGLLARRSYETGYENIFLGAAFFANWGKSNWKLYFPTRIGCGVNSFTRTVIDRLDIVSFALYASAGISYRFSKSISLGVFSDFAPDVDDFVLEYLGLNAGISFHF